jgi:hypothetical protein
MENDVVAWGMSSSKYVQEAVKNTEIYLAENFGGRKLPVGQAKGPWPTEYLAETDVTPELTPKLVINCKSVYCIGLLTWEELTLLQRLLLASAMAMPREGHLDAVFHVFAYLKRKHNSQLVFDPTYPEIDLLNFPEVDWKSTYGDVQEAIPYDLPKPRGKDVNICLFVDADHVGDKRVRRSRTGFFIFLNSALVMWLSKKQATIEKSVFGSNLWR